MSDSQPSSPVAAGALEKKSYLLAVIALVLGIAGSWLTFLIGWSQGSWETSEKLSAAVALRAAREEMESQFDSVVESSRSELSLAMQDIRDARRLVVGFVNGATNDAAVAASHAATARAMAESAETAARTKAQEVTDAIKALDGLKGKVDEVAALIATRLLQDPLKKQFLELAFASVDSRIKGAIQSVEAGIQGLQREVCPVGSVVAWPLPIVLDQNNEVAGAPGWSICDGRELASRKYVVLAQVLGETYGPATSGHVRLPDFRGCFLRGIGGESLGLGLKQPWATAFPDKSAESMYTSNGQGTAAPGDKIPVLSDPRHIGTDIKWASETRPVNYAVNWIIRIR